MVKKRLIPIMAVAAMMASCGQNQLKSGIDMANLDKTVDPAEDFYRFACGGWMDNNPLPAAYSRFGTFDKLIENNDSLVNGLLTELLEKTFDEGTTERKLSDLYKLAMDSTRRDEDGSKPLMPVIEKLEGAKTVEELFAVQKELAPMGDDEFFATYIGADERNSKQNILNVYQGGITLGEKEYYLATDSATTAIREAYKKHIVRMFTLFGFDEKASEKKMANVMKLETALATASKSSTELRDPIANYNKMTIDEFNAQYPNLKLAQLLDATGFKAEHYGELVVGQPDFLKAVNSMLATITADEYRDYMEWGQIMSAASYLSADIVEAQFDFFGRVMSGRKENHPLWKRATSQVEGMMGEALGKMYVERYFPAEAKERMVHLVANLQESLKERIMAQTWMSDSTKAAALEKLSTFYVKVGYPDKWTDMTALTVDPTKSYYENIEECRRFWCAYQIEKKAGKPVDRDEWFMNPQTVNAYYNPTTNEICFPAGILQWPFFDLEADDAFNYGAIGVVIGHEMTHGFDDAGRHYDKDGNLSEWWTEADATAFGERAKVCADYFANLEVLPGLKANGQLTLGENLADHGGLQVAFNAYKNATKDAPLPDVDGFTADQRFFLAYACLWAANITDEEIRNRTTNDPHSLGKWRVNAALSHVDAWYEAFNVQPGSKMYVPKEERLNLW